MHLGKPLGDYNLTCPPIQQTSQTSDAIVSQPASLSPVSDDCVLSSPSVGDVLSASRTDVVGCNLSPCSTHVSCPLFANAALSFIKAYRLKGDTTSLKRLVGERFSSDSIVEAKTKLWEVCKQKLEGSGLSFQTHRDFTGVVNSLLILKYFASFRDPRFF